VNLTKHFKQRYVERIVGITTPTERGQYIVANDAQINEHAHKLFEHARFLWRGQLGDNITRNYYIRDDIIIVTDTDNTCFVTVFKVDLGFPEAVNRQTVKGLLKEIDKLNVQYEKAEAKAKSKMERLQAQVSTIDEQIASLERQIETLRHKRDTIQAEIKDVMNDARYIQEELRKLCVTLCNSVDYRTDLAEWRKQA
jgi:DNA repair exonuclease SbcCD ATPase subunit